MQEPETAARFTPSVPEEGKKVWNPDSGLKIESGGPGVTWASGDPQQSRALRKAYREKERRKQGPTWRGRRGKNPKRRKENCKG